MQLTVPANFYDKDPITVFKVQELFQVACDQNGVHEGAALYCFQFSLNGQAKGHVVPKISSSANPMDARDRELLRTYPEVIHYLLETYATDNHIMDAYQGVFGYHQRSNMSEMDLADQL